MPLLQLAPITYERRRDEALDAPRPEPEPEPEPEKKPEKPSFSWDMMAAAAVAGPPVQMGTH